MVIALDLSYLTRLNDSNTDDNRWRIFLDIKLTQLQYVMLTNF